MSKTRLIIFIVIVIIMSTLSYMVKAATFEYKNKLVIQAPDYKTAAKLCFKKLNPVFVSEEAGLEIIDICSNPVKGEIK